jgi:hypothetical protein
LKLALQINFPRDPGSGHRRLQRSRGRSIFRLGNHRNRLDNIQPSAAQQLVDHCARQSARVVFHAYRLRRLVKLHSPNAIHIAHLRERQHSALGRRSAIAVDHVKLRHASILAVPPTASAAHSLLR